MEKLLRIENLKKHFKVPGGTLKAVDGITFDIYKGETFGLVGESGCGKSTCGRTILRLYEPTDGAVYFKDQNIYTMQDSQLHEMRQKMQMIFQDPYASLDPRMPIVDIVAESLDIHKKSKSPKERQERVEYLLSLVGLGKEHIDRFPHEFSGGQRQRVGIARALASEPEFIVCDEPISALDVSIQAQVVNLLKKLQEDFGLTYLFIAHDLSMVRYISDRVGVMYLGSMVETASSDELYNNPIHPYTKALLSAIPIPDPKVQKSKRRLTMEGDVPSPINPADCCRLSGRCEFALDICSKEQPPLEEIKPGHFTACHRAKEFI